MSKASDGGGKTPAGELPATGFDVLAFGECADESWRLLSANGRLLSLLGSVSVASDPEALMRWLNAGKICAIEYESGSSGAFSFIAANSNNWLICWWQPEKQPARRYILIFPNGEAPPQHMGANRELDGILDFIHDGIWIIDGNGTTLRINQAMERISGISAAEVVGRHVSEPLHEGRFKTCVTLRALEERRTVTLFDDYSNGKRCLNTSTPIFDKNGNVWRVIAAIRDLTELDELKDRLSRVEVEALAHKMRARGLEHDAQAGLLGQSDILQKALEDIGKAAQSEAVTLLLGETGTGKTLCGRLIHDMSSRAQRPFVAINCGAIPPGLIESELFGYEKGAFTGAGRSGKPGMLELASGGTLLLDEIGELSLSMQARLLHILDGQPIYRVGSTRPIKMTARILAATNRPLEDMVKSGEFREDLYYRLRVLCVELPPLRERHEDILILAWHFLSQTGTGKRFSRDVEELFMAWHWPGNVRELQSVVQSLATLSDGRIIMPGDLPRSMRRQEPIKPGMGNLPHALANLEKEMIAQALAETGSTYKAAECLGISQSQVARKARKYGLGRMTARSLRRDG